MKKLFTILASLLITTSIFAQVPNKISYQTIIRNSSNSLVVNQTIGIRISILQNSPNGSAVYIESQNPATNNNGLASIEIGTGTNITGDISSINWAEGPYFIKTETDPNGGSTYTITVVTQLLSVPYAIFSGNGIQRVSPTGDSLILGNGTSIIIPGISAANTPASVYQGLWNGTYTGDDNGTFEIYVDNIGNITGNFYSTINGGPTPGSGSVNLNGSFSGVTANGTNIQGTMIVDGSNGTANGVWNNPLIGNGTLTATRVP